MNDNDQNLPNEEVGTQPEEETTSDVEQSEVEEMAEETPSSIEAGEPVPNFEVKREAVGEAPADMPSSERSLHVLMEPADEVRRTIESMKSDKLPGNEKERKEYADSIAMATTHSPQQGKRVDPFPRDSAAWKQGLEHNDEFIGAGKPRYSRQGGRLSGNDAEMRLRAAVGLGTVISVPLWHTGIWLKLKAPQNATLLELERRISNEKLTLGRATYGAAFSNIAIYMNSFVISMVLDQVYGGTYTDLSPKALKDVIRVTDIPQLVWGIAAITWPDGFPLRRPCVSDPSKCNHIDEGKISLGALSWVDNNSLSPYQRNHMAQREADVNDDSLNHYMKEHIAPQTKMVKINDAVTIRLKVPTISEYEQSGFDWVDTIVKTVDKAFGQNLRGDERNDYIMQQGTVTSLMRYAHWISEIVFTDDDEENAYVSDRETIKSNLETLSASKEMRNKVIDGVEEFMRNSIISAIGIPRYDCPKCKGEPHESDVPKRLPEIIQLEVNEVFFTLQYMRVIETLESS